MQYMNKREQDDFDKVKVWEYSETWNNPFGDDEVDDETLDDSEAAQVSLPKYDKKQIKSRDKKKKRRKKKVSREESSHADSLLSSILSESELEDVERMNKVEQEDEMDDCDSMNVLASSSKKYHRKASSPPTRARRERPKPLSPKQVLSSDEDEAPVSVAESLQVQAGGHDTDSAINVDNCVTSGDEVDINDPFAGMNSLIKNKPTKPSRDVSDDEQPPSKTNPFEDGEEADSVATDEDEMHIETTLKEDKGVIEISPRSKAMSESEEEEPEEEDEEDEEEEEEEDIVESSKRLLRMCDERIQYQHHNEEVQQLKATIEQQKNQAEAMAEQLRRAVETKCDLVLAQNEMERRHEQDMIAKDSEIKNMRAYIQEILEAQAKSELNFMNEISSLAGNLERMEAKRKKENAEKDSEIERLESKVKDLKTGSVRSTSSRHAFRGRFTGSSGSVGSHSTGKQSLSSRSRQKVTPIF